MSQRTDQGKDWSDDLRFAHVLADAADDITMRRLRALDLRVESKPDLTPVTDADLATEESLAQRAEQGQAAGCDPRRGARQVRGRPALLGDRPDRRHPELRPWRSGLGDPDRADGWAAKSWSG